MLSKNIKKFHEGSSLNCYLRYSMKLFYERYHSTKVLIKLLLLKKSWINLLIVYEDRFKERGYNMVDGNMLMMDKQRK